MRRLSLAALPLLTGCAAMFGTGPFMVPVSSSPSGATVVYRENAVGVTPCTIRMDNRHRTLRLRAEGHHEQEVDVGAVDNAPLVLLGCLVWGPFELLCDAIGGAFMRTDDRHVHVSMVPAAYAAPSAWRRPPER